MTPARPPGASRLRSGLYDRGMADLTIWHKAVVLEDAVSGVRAGAAGDFGLVIGVDRGAGEAVLEGAGANLVVDDLGDLVPEGAR